MNLQVSNVITSSYDYYHSTVLIVIPLVGYTIVPGMINYNIHWAPFYEVGYGGITLYVMSWYQGYQSGT